MALARCLAPFGGLIALLLLLGELGELGAWDWVHPGKNRGPWGLPDMSPLPPGLCHSLCG